MSLPLSSIAHLLPERNVPIAGRHADFSLDPSQWGNDISGAWNGLGNDISQAWNGLTGGTKSGGTVTQPNLSQSNYDFTGSAEGAQELATAYGTQAGTMANQQVANPNAAADRGAALSSLGGMGQQSAWLQAQMNGTGPNLAAAQMSQATDQSIAAQNAMAHSAGGSLAAAGADRQAAATAAGMQMGAAQQSMQGEIQQQYDAANAQQQLLGTQAQTALGLQGQDQGFALSQAQLQQQGALASEGMQNQVYGAEQAGLENYSQQNASNQLAAEGANQQNDQFNAGQSMSWAQGLMGAAGGLASLADADLKEPGPGGPGTGPAHFALREESKDPAGRHRAFIAAIDYQDGTIGKVDVKPLSASEAEQVHKPHGAGPLGANDPRRISGPYVDRYSDMNMGAAFPLGYSSAPTPGGGFGSQGQHALSSIMRKLGAKTAGAMPANTYGLPANPYGDDPLPANPYDAAAGTDMSGAAGAGDLSSLADTGFGDMDLSRRPTTLGHRGYADADLLDLAPGHHTHHADVNPPVRAVPIGQALGLGAAPAPTVWTPQVAARPEDLGIGPDDPAYDAQMQRYADSYDAVRRNAHADDALSQREAKLRNDPMLASMSDADRDVLLAAPPPKAAGPGAGMDPTKLVTGPGAQAPSVTAPPANPLGFGQGGGGPVKQSWQSTIAPQAQAEMRAAQQTQADAADAQARALEHQAEDKGVAAGLQGQQLGKQADEIRANAAEHEAKIQQATEKLDQASKDAAEQKIDPDRWWKAQNTGDRIRYGIAAALGGFLQGMRGGPNVALQAIEQHKTADIDAQRQAIEAKKGRIGDMHGIVADMYRRFGNMDQAVAASHVLTNQQLAAQADEQAAASNSEAVLANAQAFKASLQKDAAEWTAKTVRPVMTGGGGAGSAAQAYQAYAKKWLEGDQKTPKLSYQDFVTQMGGAASAPAASTTAGKPNARLLRTQAQLDADEKAAKELQGFLGRGSSLSPSDRQYAASLAATLREHGHTGVPENPLQLFDNTTGRARALGPVLDDIATQKARLATAGPGGDEADDKEDDGFKADE